MEGGDHNQNDELYPIAVLIDELKVGYPPVDSSVDIVLTEATSMTTWSCG